MAGEASFTTSEQDLVAANRLHVRQLWNRRATLRGWILSTVALALVLFVFCPRLSWLLLAAPFAAAAFMAVGAVLAQLTFVIAARRHYRQGKAFWRPTKIAWDDTSIRFTSDRGHVEHKWADYFAWAADDQAVLLYLSANSFLTIPSKNLSTNGRTEIIADLQRAGVGGR
jgi:hypothetical protein